MNKDRKEPKDSCIICGANTEYFFSKNYETHPGSPFKDVLTVDYWKCKHCGFVISKTHQKMTKDQWSDLNTSWHHLLERENKDDFQSGTVNQPPYADQALSLMMLEKNGIIDIGDTLDYAAGYGTLSRFLKKYMDADIKVFDRYVHDDENNLDYIAEKDLKKYKCVINSAMFEHVLDRKSLDDVNNLVKEDGVLMLHTVICENIPNDPNWFYLDPVVHTAFHTNKSMEILMGQWGYGFSAYSPQAKSWFLFKKDCGLNVDLEYKIEKINKEIQTNYFHYKNGFVDYWKGF